MSRATWAVTWDELRAVRERSMIDADAMLYFLQTVPKKYQLGAALALSILKWERGQPADRRGYDACGLCRLRTLRGYGCFKCPLFEYDPRAPGTCHDVGSLWIRWFEADTINGRDAPADDLYNALVDLYQREYARVCGG